MPFHRGMIPARLDWDADTGSVGGVVAARAGIAEASSSGAATSAGRVSDDDNGTAAENMPKEPTITNSVPVSVMISVSWQSHHKDRADMIQRHSYWNLYHRIVMWIGLPSDPVPMPP